MCRLSNIFEINYYNGGQFLDIDFSSKRNLEILSTIRDNKRKGSLIWIVDETRTSMGARMLKSWLEKPLVSCIQIQKRLSAVDELVGNTMLREELRGELSSIQDIERLLGKVISGSANCRDLLALGKSLIPIPAILNNLLNVKCELLREITGKIDPLEDYAPY
jgi:DNA mismatch repair protein MutS